MKLKPTLALLHLLAATTAIQAQVTIGSTEPPRSGSLLDLKEGTSTTKGLNMPRVELTDLHPDTPAELSASIGGTGNWALDDHTALVVYNIEPDNCATEPIHEGLYVFDGYEWQFQGQELSSEVHTYTDARDGNKYLYREFYYMNGNTKVSAGEWMLQNLRYVPDNTDAGFTGFTHTANGSSTGKNWSYPRKATGTYNAEQAKAEWAPITGILYTWAAAVNGRIPNGDEGQGTTYESESKGVQGICPKDWHMPTDREWNLLERAVYSNPTAYSTYTAAEAFNPVSWQTSWEASTVWHGSSVTANGHGKAMLAGCPSPGSTTASAGRSLPAEQGGFNVYLVGSGSGSNYANYTYLWSGSAGNSGDSGNAWYRVMTRQSTGHQVFRYNASRSVEASIRCVKD